MCFLKWQPFKCPGDAGRNVTNKMQTRSVKVITIRRMISLLSSGLLALDKQVRAAYSYPSPNQVLKALNQAVE